ncbi:hypothetical protein ADIWIN_3306 [Winogradskyella psychrotolerans RS-3]|uniref:Uncharacterized protein n=1 Tax=Winogradskyella psychrotolerans RS-3 TaxID=641526 RepID=S7WW44_9FLAO|nr:hypothetical protein ADIWIN_3306 [Winogradskyella psychrotolerans RS-3]
MLFIFEATQQSLHQGYQSQLTDLQPQSSKCKQTTKATPTVIPAQAGIY